MIAEYSSVGCVCREVQWRRSMRSRDDQVCCPWLALRSSSWEGRECWYRSLGLGNSADQRGAVLVSVLLRLVWRGPWKRPDPGQVLQWLSVSSGRSWDRHVPHIGGGVPPNSEGCRSVGAKSLVGCLQLWTIRAHVWVRVQSGHVMIWWERSEDSCLILWTWRRRRIPR